MAMVLASSICLLNLDKEDLPRALLSVILTGVASDNPDIGYLSIIENLLIRITQINFIESMHSTSSHKSSGYAWEKKQTEDSFTQQSSDEIPKLSSLSLPDEDDGSQNVISNQATGGRNLSR
ncbi:hypothetical protein RhiirA4_457562 [Rhizophagus irregularis]|uniref:Uncharacterized protein n=1 Tax=Rhizophagus irregularis TaxID=588596 RepID=A0A2I1GA94_9GLOM|nr:hypothetical protein RhiirA4_457562 [Rhizophagus irregularis]